MKQKSGGVSKQGAQSRGNVGCGGVRIPRQNRTQAGYIVIGESPFQLQPEPVHPIEVPAFNLQLQVLDSLHALTHERAHHEQRRHNQDDRNGECGDQSGSRGPESRPQSQVSRIGNHHDNDCPSQRGQKRLKHQKHEVRQDHHDPVKKH